MRFSSTNLCLMAVVLAVATNVTGCSKGVASGGGGVTLSIADATAAEGQAGERATLSFTVSIDGRPRPAAAVSIDWQTVEGTAQAGSDYETRAGTLTFTSDGALTQQIDITVLGDDAQESDEQLTVTLSNIKNGVLGTAQAVGTIVNDDAPVYPKVAIGDRALAEGNAPLVTVFSFPVTLDRLPAAGQNLTLD